MQHSYEENVLKLKTAPLCLLFIHLCIDLHIHLEVLEKM